MKRKRDIAVIVLSLGTCRLQKDIKPTWVIPKETRPIEARILLRNIPKNLAALDIGYIVLDAANKHLKKYKDVFVKYPRLGLSGSLLISKLQAFSLYEEDNQYEIEEQSTFAAFKTTGLTLADMDNFRS